MATTWIKLTVDAFGQTAGTTLAIDAADLRLPQLLNARLATVVANPGGTVPTAPAPNPGGDYATDAELLDPASATGAALRAQLVPRPAGGTDGQALVKSGSSVVWGTVAGGGGNGGVLTPTATKTAAYTAAVGDLAVMNVAGGATVLTLPAAPADKAQVGFRAVGATTATPLTVTRGGTDTIGDTGATSVTLPLSGEVTVYQYQASASRWLAVSNVKPLAALDGRYVAQGKQALDLVDFGAKCDGQVGYYGQATAGSAAFTDPTANFTSAAIGKTFTMPYAGATLGVWTGTVTAVPSSTTLTISTTAGTSSQITGTAGAMTSGAQVLTDTTKAFTFDLAGATITVQGAGAAGAALSGQVLAPTNTGQGVYLIGPQIGNQNSALNAGTTVSGASYTINRGMYTIGSDDAAAWAAAITAAQARLGTSTQVEIHWSGTSMVSSMPILPGGISLVGVGMDPVQTGTAYPTQGSILRAHGTFSGTQLLRVGTYSQYREDSLAHAIRSCTFDAARVVPWGIKTTGNWSSFDRVHVRNGTTGAVWLAGWQTMMRDCAFGQHGVGDCLYVQEADAQMNGGYLKSGQNMVHIGAGANDFMMTGVHTYNSWPAPVGGENRTVLIDGTANRLSFVGCYFDNVYGPQVKMVTPSAGKIEEVEFTACKFFQAGTPWYAFPDNLYPIFQLDNSAGGGSQIERLIVNGCSGSAVWSGARFSAVVNYVTNTGVSGITVANSSFSHTVALYTGSTPVQASFSHVKVLDSGAGVWRTSPFPLGNTNPLTATGTGAQTAFPITHNMNGNPKRVSVIPQTSAAAAPFYVTIAANTLTINYLTAPANTAALAWFVMVEL